MYCKTFLFSIHSTKFLNKLVLINHRTHKFSTFLNLLSQPRVISNLNKYSTKSSIEQNAIKDQNEFHFTKSNLLDLVKSNQHEYSKLYESIPVVILLGWTGSRDSHLKKYSNIYSNLGYHTIRFAPSHGFTLFTKRQHKDNARKLFYLIKNEYKLTNNKILIHTFSNAGSFVVYQYFIQIRNGMLNNNQFNHQDYEFMSKNMSGIICDSGYGWPHNPLELTKGVTILLENQIKNRLLSLIVATGFVFSLNVYLFSMFGKDKFSVSYRTLVNDRIEVPFLFMYSKGDKILDPVDMYNFTIAKKRLLPNLYIKSAVFEDAEHVLIYLKYPEDYTKNIVEHLKVCKIDIPSFIQKLNFKF